MLNKLLSICVLVMVSSPSFAADRLIIKYKPTTEQSKLLSTAKISIKSLRQQEMKPLSIIQRHKITKDANIQISKDRAIANGAHVLYLANDVDSAKLTQIIQDIQSDPNVEYVVEDRILKPMITAPQINPAQWDMQANFNDTTNPSWFGDNFTGAWSYLSTQNLLPGNGVTVAVIDTGYTPHPNILSNLQNLATGSESYGYQFMSDCRIAGTCTSATTTNNTLLPQSNGLDLGDYVTQSDINNSNGFFAQDCLSATSSWHGTHVTGTIIGQGYDAMTMTGGVKGGAYSAKVIPVRVLGKCGGYTSDIINGMYWAAGFVVPNATINPNPAQVISMSLGGTGSCSTAQQDAINNITDTGVVIVVAAGNSTANVSTATPANCSNVISVAANGPTQSLAYYSNWGNTTISASGGDTAYGSSSQYGKPGKILSTIWSSSQAYSASDSGTYIYYQGTSMATPHVSAAIANIISVLNNASKTYTTASITQILQSTALYPDSSSGKNCNTAYNGGCVASGAMNVESAIYYAYNSAIITPTTNPTSGGGCSMIQNGNDGSILLLIILIMTIGTIRYIQRKTK